MLKNPLKLMLYKLCSLVVLLYMNMNGYSLHIHTHTHCILFGFSLKKKVYLLHVFLQATFAGPSQYRTH